MNITKRDLERLIRNAFEAGAFAGQECDSLRDLITCRAEYVREEMLARPQRALGAGTTRAGDWSFTTFTDGSMDVSPRTNATSLNTLHFHPGDVEALYSLLTVSRA